MIVAKSVVCLLGAYAALPAAHAMPSGVYSKPSLVAVTAGEARIQLIQRRDRAKSNKQNEGSEAARPAQTSPPLQQDSAQPSAQPLQQRWSESQINEARDVCLRLLGPIRVVIEPHPPINEGRCGTAFPVMLRAVAGEQSVTLSPPLPLTCQMVASVHDWIEAVVQPLARAMLGERIARLQGIGSYQCRNRVGDEDKSLSEHALANAVDVSAFVTVSGRSIEVKRSWGPTARDTALGAGARSDGDRVSTQQRPDERVAGKGGAATSPQGPTRITIEDERLFLKAVHRASCRIFSTVLGPEANEAHRDHLHLDLAERRGGNAFCE